MNKLYVVDNHQDYSSHTYWLVEADADEWDDLEGILTRGEQEQTIEAVATEWSGTVQTCHPLDTLRVDHDLFTMGDYREGEPEPLGPGNYWKSFGGPEKKWFFLYTLNEPRPSRRDAENLLVEMRRRAAVAEPHCFDNEELAMFETAFAAGEFPEAST